MLKKIIISSTFLLLSFSISSAETPAGYYAPASIAGGTLNAQDSNWPVYDETISFSNAGTFTASITNGIDDPSGSGSYTYSKTGTNSATLSYSIDGAGISFEYALQFTGENTGIYSKYANYGSEEDITTGPFSLSGVAVPEQFDWEDYDDFSSPNVDTSKWSMGHWDGGNLPTISSGKIVFSGNTVSGFKDVLPTAGMLAFNSGIGPLLEEAFSSTNGTQSHSYLELLSDDQILGIEAEIQLPADAPSSVAIGLYASDWAKAFSEDQSDKSFFGLDLWRDHIDIEYVDPNTGEFISNDLSTTAGSSHTFAFIFEEGKVFMFVDGGKVAEFSSANFSRDSILIRAWNNAGEPFSAYAQNVRVIRNWEDYDDFSIDSLDANKWDISYYGGGKPPSVENGVVKLYGRSKANFNEFKIGSDFSTNYPNAENDLSASGPHSNVGIANATLEGIEFEVMMPSSVPSETGIGLYVLNTQELGNAVDSAARANATKAHLDLWYSSGDPQIGLGISAESTIYIPSEFNVYYRLGILFGNSTTSFFVNGEKKAEFTGTFTKDYLLLRGTNENDVSFDTYLDNVRVFRRSQETTEPDPVKVVSDPNGQAVVVQVGDEYKWNSTLDGVTLWGVEQSSDGWSSMTMRFENGRNFGNQGFFDSVAQPQPYDVSYEIDENGYIKSLEDDGDYQYYNPVSVENGVISTIQNDEGVESVADNGVNQVDQWFFTTRAAAEEYYYSKVNPKSWMWFDHYPWVYSNEEQGWLYFHPSGGTLMYWSNKGQAWRQFN